MLNPRGIKLEIYICRPWVKHSDVKLETNHCLPFLILLSHWNRHSTPAHIPSTIQFQRHHLCWDLLHGSELQLKATWTTPFVTEQDPMGPSQERPLLPSSLLSSSLKNLDNRSVQLSHSVRSNSLWPHGLQHNRLPCPLPTHGAYSNSCASSWWCHPTRATSLEKMLMLGKIKGRRRRGQQKLDITNSVDVFLFSRSVMSDFCDPMDCSMPGFLALHLPELAQTHVCWVGHAIELSLCLSFRSPPDFNLSQYQGLL